MRFKFHIKYFVLAVILFITEVLIATFLKTGFIRYTFGDYLVVILLYCLLKSFVNAEAFKIAIGVLLFAFFVEFLQLINLLDILSLNNNHLAKLILGSTFHISDLMAYTLGIITVLIIEYKIYKLWIT